MKKSLFYDLTFGMTSAPVGGNIVDYDGNIYTYVAIGTQQWLVENFRCEHYIDGTAIPNLTDNGDWTADTTGAYCYYDNDEATYKSDYGALYNWYAVNNAHGLGITGWRVPSQADIEILIAFLGSSDVAGGKIKETGLSHWLTPNTGATNEYGFTALPGGFRGNTGVFSYLTYRFGMKLSTDYDADTAYGRYAYSHNETFGLVYSYKKAGFSVRLMRDV